MADRIVVGADGIPVMAKDMGNGTFQIASQTTIVGSLANVSKTIGQAIPTDVILQGISDGTNIRAVTGTLEVPLLTSTPRTSTTITAIQTNINARALQVMILVTIAGTGQLSPSIRGYAGNLGPTNLLIPPALIAVTPASQIYEIALGSGAAINAVVSASPHACPRRWDFGIGHSDTSAWTYEVSYSYLM